LFNDEIKFYVDKFSNKTCVPIFTNSSCEKILDLTDYHFFGLDGWSSEAHFKITNYLHTMYVEPLSFLNDNSKVIFFNEAEGYCTDYIFDAIHYVIKVHHLNPTNVIFRNLATNNQKMYDQYCNKRGITDKITLMSSYYFNNSQAPVYKKYEQYGQLFEPKDKKLFINLNWNGWKHRFLAIALFHYYDLVDDAFITSPLETKFVCDNDKDFNFLFNGTATYLDNHRLKNDILEKLLSLRVKYPLMIDDRTKFKDSNDAIYSPEVKIPIFTARRNSFFEVVSETHISGPTIFTEKTYWPIMEGLPFFQINSANCLDEIRKMGYQTFGKLIDEGYDCELNDIERIIKVVQELVRLRDIKNKDFVSFLKLINDLSNITEYNKDIFYTTRYRKC